MIQDIAAIVSGVAGVVIVGVSLFEMGGLPEFGLFCGALLLVIAGFLGFRPDKPL